MTTSSGPSQPPKLNHARCTPNLKARVHYVWAKTLSGVYNHPRSLCGQIPISGLSDPNEIGRWHWTAESVNCKMCQSIARGIL